MDTKSAGMENGTTQQSGEVLVTRTIDAPRELVFKAWTEPGRLMRWWAPKGWSTHSCQVDLRPGGVFHYCMRSPEGKDFWGRGIYREISEPRRLVYTDSFSDEAGRLVEPARYGMSRSYPAEARVTVTFAEREGMTRIVLHHALPESAAGRADVQQGWDEMLERLAAGLEDTGMRIEAIGSEAAFIRAFAAPRERVFEAWTDPARLAQWWGPHGIAIPVCEMDVRPGGSYRIVMRAADGAGYPLKGVYREIAAPERLVMTINWEEHPAGWQSSLSRNRGQTEGEPAREAVNTVTFEERGGKTRLTIRLRFDSPETCGAMMKMGMAEGWRQSLERLDALLMR